MRLFKQILCVVCGGDPELWTNCQDCGGTTKYEPITPADLLAVTKELELRAVMVLGELKKRIAKDKAIAEERKGDEPYGIIVSTYNCVETMIADLESGLDLGKAKEIREKAEAWDLFYKKTLKLAGGHLSKSWPGKVALELRRVAKINKETMEHYLAQAEIEAEKGDKPNDE